MFFATICFFAVTVEMQRYNFCVANVDAEIVREVTFYIRHDIRAEGSFSYLVSGTGRVLVDDDVTAPQYYIMWEYFYATRYLTVYTTFDQISSGGFE